ncbi:putative terpene synthase 2 [Glycine soja]
MSLPASTLASIQHAVSDQLKRPCVSFAPCIWGDTFLEYASQFEGVNDDEKQQAQTLRNEVQTMFQSSIDQNIIQKLNLIDSVQRFGVSYHFQQEINQALEQIHNSFTKNNTISDDGNHHSLALLFRLLRQQGYQISSSAFNKLKNDQGNFSETLANDIQGLCSLYEAAHLRTPEDDILEEACDFSNTHMKSLANQLSPSLAAQINHCLRLPLNKSLIRWWKKSNFETKVPYARGRLVEAYLWSLAMSYKPEHSLARMFVGKLIAVVCLLDDTYDAYGTIQELELFTEAIQRWNKSPIESLPQCMKVVFDTVVELGEEIELATTESGKSSFVVQYFKQAVFNLIKGYMAEAKWCHEGYIPTYDEYKVNGILTSCFPLFITSFIGLGEFANKDVFDWIFSDPNIIKVVSIIGRVLDDMGSHKFEQQRVHVASAVECCMKQYNISQAEAYHLIHNDVEDGWKVINEECLKSNDIPKSVLDCVVNLARMSMVSYENHQDKFTNGELLKGYVSSLLMDPMCLEQHQ